MISEEKQDKFDEEVNEIIEMILDDVFKDFPTYHLGTFAEFKNVDEFNKLSFPDDVISKSNCGWTTCDIQEAIRRAKEYEDKSK